MLPARTNPFRTERIEALHFRLDDAGWNDLLLRFAAARWRGVLVGPHGSGKTTLREELERHFSARGWRVRTLVLGDQRPIGWNGLRALSAGADDRTLLSLDGIDRIGAVTWWRFAHATQTIGGILATSHAYGRLPLLHRHETSPDLLIDLVEELIGEVDAALHQRCVVLFRHHQGDLRACLRQLYDDLAMVGAD